MVPEIFKGRNDTLKRFVPSGPGFSTPFLVYFFHRVVYYGDCDNPVDAVIDNVRLLTKQKDFAWMGGFSRIVELRMFEKEVKADYQLVVSMNRVVNCYDEDEMRELIPDFLQ